MTAAPVSQVLSEAADTTLWCLHVLGMDDVYPAPDRATAQLWATQQTVSWHFRNERPHQFDPVLSWVVAEWPHDPLSHADGLEQSIADNTWPVDPLAALAKEQGR